MNTDGPDKIRATTVLAVRKNGRCVIGGDGQVTLGDTIMKHKATKVRRMYQDTVLAGFAVLLRMPSTFLSAWKENWRVTAETL